MADAFAVNVANVITHDRALARAREPLEGSGAAAGNALDLLERTAPAKPRAVTIP